jgi:hypothetical protein
MSSLLSAKLTKLSNIFAFALTKALKDLLKIDSDMFV